jgi:hypothetical protein
MPNCRARRNSGLPRGTALLWTTSSIDRSIAADLPASFVEHVGQRAHTGTRDAYQMRALERLHLRRRVAVQCRRVEQRHRHSRGERIQPNRAGIIRAAAEPCQCKCR